MCTLPQEEEQLLQLQKAQNLIKRASEICQRFPDYNREQISCKSLAKYIDNINQSIDDRVKTIAVQKKSKKVNARKVSTNKSMDVKQLKHAWKNNNNKSNVEKSIDLVNSSFVNSSNLSRAKLSRKSGSSVEPICFGNKSKIVERNRQVFENSKNTYFKRKEVTGTLYNLIKSSSRSNSNQSRPNLNSSIRSIKISLEKPTIKNQLPNKENLRPKGDNKDPTQIKTLQVDLSDHFTRLRSEMQKNVEKRKQNTTD